MLQASQLSGSLLSLGFSILLSAIFIPIFLWGLRKRVSVMQKSPDFTDRDVTAIQRQMLAFLVSVPLILLFFAVSPLIWDQPSPYTVLIGLILGFAPLAYLAVSSIRNRVAIGRGLLPVKGTKAVRSGVISLVFLVLLFGGFAIYFALYFASLQ
jgi:hypothetical protein